MIDSAVDVVREALFYTLLLATPILGAGLLVGLVVSLFQAVTQIQEQTLTFVPKMVAVFGLLAALGFWMVAQLVRFTSLLWTSFPLIVG